MSADNIGWIIAIIVVLAVVFAAVYCSMRRDDQITREIMNLEDRARTCLGEDIEKLTIEVIGYNQSGMSLRHQMRLISITHYLMGRKREYDRTKQPVGQSAGGKATAAQTPGQSPNRGEADPHGTNAGPGDPHS